MTHLSLVAQAPTGVGDKHVLEEGLHLKWREGGDGKSALSEEYDTLGLRSCLPPHTESPSLIMLYAGECQPIRK